MKVLLDYGADVSTTDNAGGTPLHSAALEGPESLCLFLLTNGPARTLEKQTPLYSSAAGIRQGVDVSARDNCSNRCITLWLTGTGDASCLPWGGAV